MPATLPDPPGTYHSPTEHQYSEQMLVSTHHPADWEACTELKVHAVNAAGDEMIIVVPKADCTVGNLRSALLQEGMAPADTLALTASKHVNWIFGEQPVSCADDDTPLEELDLSWTGQLRAQGIAKLPFGRAAPEEFGRVSDDPPNRTPGYRREEVGTLEGVCNPMGPCLIRIRVLGPFGRKCWVELGAEATVGNLRSVMDQEELGPADTVILSVFEASDLSRAGRNLQNPADEVVIIEALRQDAAWVPDNALVQVAGQSRLRGSLPPPHYDAYSIEPYTMRVKSFSC